jgi:hypothetical protein
MELVARLVVVDVAQEPVTGQVTSYSGQDCAVV